MSASDIPIFVQVFTRRAVNKLILKKSNSIMDW